MSNFQAVAITQAITVIQTLVDEETWQTEFREFFEDPELFYSFESRIQAGMVTFTLLMRNPEKLEAMIQHDFEIKENNLECVPTVDDADALVKTTIKALQMRR